MSFDALAEDFAREALALLETLEESLLSLERPLSAKKRAPLAASARRTLHTLKGNAGMVGAPELQSALHAMEDAAERLAERPDAAGALLVALDVIRTETRAIAEGRSLRDASAALKALATGFSPAEAQLSAAAAPSLDGDLRVPQGRVDQLVTAAGDMLVQNGQLQKLLAQRAAPDALGLRATLDRLDSSVGLLHQLVLRIRTVPVGQLFARFHRLVRDEAQRSGKRASLVLQGEQVEVDKAVLDQLSGALVHLVRNAVVHGIEGPEERAARGKPAEGQVTLSARPSGGRVEIRVEDDGGGLDHEAIVRRAEKMGLDPSVGSPTLIFEPGLTTAELTQSAGRGVGLDAVRRSLFQIGGMVDVASQPGRGTRFALSVPASIALQRIILCDVGGVTYAIPASSVIEATHLPASKVRWLGAGAAVEHRGGLVPLVDEVRLLGAPRSTGGYAIFLRAGAVAALRVDALLGQQDSVFQPLDSAVRGVGPASGATLMGDGRVVLRLDPDQLVASTVRKPGSRAEVRS